MKKTLKKYLELYAEPESSLGQHLFKVNDFDYTVVLPLCDELEFFPRFVEGLKVSASKARKNILLIVVVNRQVVSGNKVYESNLELLDLWEKRLKSFFEERKGTRFFSGSEESLTFLFLDRNSKGFEFTEKRGVGLARKIGCDLACSFYFYQKVCSNHIFTTDCDVALPNDFFLVKEKLPEKFLLLSPFKHFIEKDMADFQRKAIRLYEGYMRYYVAGLKGAESPYAFHTVGSLQSFSADAYALVRGFPKKKMAGEDFYFQNKVLKVASCFERDSSPLFLSSRLSERVPFGTGQSVIKIINLLESGETYKVENPKCFVYLSLYLKVAHSYLKEPCDLSSLLGRFCEESSFDFFKFLKQKGYLDEIARCYDKSLKIEVRKKDFNDWFDAFRTLRFIHQLSEFFPRVSCEEVLGCSFDFGFLKTTLKEAKHLQEYCC